MSNYFFGLGILSALWGVISSIAITSYLIKHGIKINYLLIRILIFKYINQYHKLTKQETGKTGSWFYSYVISMILALAFVIIGILVKNI